MLVNSRFVVRKIGEDSEGTLCGSISHQLNHDIVLSFGYRVGFLSVGQGVVGFVVVVLGVTVVMAFWSSSILLTGASSTVNMVFARFENVWLTTIL